MSKDMDMFNVLFAVFLSSFLFAGQDWKTGTHCMGPGVRKYEKDPPPLDDEIDLQQFSFRMVVVERVPGKSGWSSYRFSVPQKIRALYHDDVVYGPDWRQLMRDFDTKLLGKTGCTHRFIVQTNTHFTMH